MNDTHFEALSAFFDGEVVDADLLAESLSDPGAAGLLAEFAAMRRHVQQDPSRPAPGFVEAMHARLARARPRWRVRRWLMPGALAASLVLVAGLVGFRLGSSDRVAAVPPAARHMTGPPGPGAGAGTPVATNPPTARPSAAVTGGADRDAGPPAAGLRLRMARWEDASPEGTGGR